jgi:hypothetical protein
VAGSYDFFLLREQHRDRGDFPLTRARGRSYSLFLTPTEVVLTSGTDVVRMMFRGAGRARWRMSAAVTRRLSTSALSGGVHVVAALYAGTGTTAPSNSVPTLQVVQ